MKKKFLNSLNKVFNQASFSMSAKWKWEKTTPFVVVKRTIGHSSKLEIVHIGSLEYWGTDKPSVRLYHYEVLDTRFLTPELRKEVEGINNQIELLEDKRNKLLKDKFLELPMVEDSEVERYYKKAKSF